MVLLWDPQKLIVLDLCQFKTIRNLNWMEMIGNVLKCLGNISTRQNQPLTLREPTGSSCAKVLWVISGSSHALSGSSQDMPQLHPIALSVEVDTLYLLCSSGSEMLENWWLIVRAASARCWLLDDLWRFERSCPGVKVSAGTGPTTPDALHKVAVLVHATKRSETECTVHCPCTYGSWM